MSSERSLEAAEGTLAWRALCRLSDAIQLLLVALVLDLLLFSMNQPVAWFRVVVLVLATVGVALNRAWLVLAAIQIGLIVLEPATRLSETSILAMLYCGLLVGLVIYAGGSRRLADGLNRRLAIAVFSLLGYRSTSDLSPQNLGEPPSASPIELPNGWRPLVVGAGLLLMSVALGALALTRLPLHGEGRTAWLRASLRDDVIWPGATVVVVAMLLWIVVREMAWRQMTPTQAGLTLRSQFTLDLRKDLGLIARKANKLRRGGPRAK